MQRVTTLKCKNPALSRVSKPDFVAPALAGSLNYIRGPQPPSAAILATLRLQTKHESHLSEQLSQLQQKSATLCLTFMRNVVEVPSGTTDNSPVRFRGALAR